MTKTLNPVALSASNTELRSFYTENHNIFKRGPVNQHVVHIAGGFYGTMDHAVEAIGEAFESEDAELSETVALSGLKEYVGSLMPVLGGSAYDQDEGRQYLKPSGKRELKKFLGPYHWQCVSGSFGPYHELLCTRISRFDFGQAVVHIMTNTELQNTYSQFGWPTDPRLALIETIRPSPAEYSTS